MWTRSRSIIVLAVLATVLCLIPPTDAEARRILICIDGTNNDPNDAVPAYDESGLLVDNGISNVLKLHILAGGRLDTGAGAIQYAGAPVEDLVLETGAGSITIFLPRDAAVELDLDTGVGSIDVDDFAVTGEVSARDVEGTIGAGGPTIEAHTGAGGIDVRVLE